MKGSETVEAYIAGAGAWSEGLEVLRAVLRRTRMEETLKWGAPAYLHQGRIVVGLMAFKGYFGLWFHDARGVDDPDGVLQRAPGGKSASMRQWRFASAEEIPRRKVAEYVRRAIAAAEQPRAPRKRSTGKPKLPPELASALAKAPGRARPSTR